jgi:hypothetical protein
MPVLAEAADELQRAMRMGPGLDMQRDEVRAGLGEGLDVGIDRRDHQMHVEQLARAAADRLQDVGPEGDVGHEMPVHHVAMDPVAAGGVDPLDLGAQRGEVGGEDRGRDADGAGHGSGISFANDARKPPRRFVPYRSGSGSSGVTSVSIWRP